jgi:hypothetical protein
MKTALLAAALLAAPFTAQAAHAPVSAGLVLSDPVGFGGFLSFWPLDALSIDGVLTHAVADVGVTGHIPLGADPAHRLLVGAEVGHVHNASRSLVGGTHTGLSVGYGYQTEWDIRLLCGIGGQDAVGWTFGPAFSLLVGRFF